MPEASSVSNESSTSPMYVPSRYAPAVWRNPKELSRASPWILNSNPLTGLLSKRSVDSRRPADERNPTSAPATTPRPTSMPAYAMRRMMEQAGDIEAPRLKRRDRIAPAAQSSNPPTKNHAVPAAMSESQGAHAVWDLPYRAQYACQPTSRTPAEASSIPAATAITGGRYGRGGASTIAGRIICISGTQASRTSSRRYRRRA